MQMNMYGNDHVQRPRQGLVRVHFTAITEVEGLTAIPVPVVEDDDELIGIPCVMDGTNQNGGYLRTSVSILKEYHIHIVMTSAHGRQADSSTSIFPTATPSKHLSQG